MIDWKSNFKKPTIIEIEDVNIVLGVLNQSEWQETEEIFYPSKIDKLKSICKEKLEVLLESVKTKDSSSYMSNLVIKIIDNIQLSLKDIHFRIEETNTKIKYSMGLTLKELNIISTNDQWKHIFIERTPNQIYFYKLLSLDSFGFYLNENETQFVSNDFDPADFKLRYLIDPMSLQIKMIQNNAPKEGIEPSYKAEISLNHLGIIVKKAQYDCIISILNNVSSYRKFQSNVLSGRKYVYFKPRQFLLKGKEPKKYTPEEKKENTLQWFKFSITMIKKQFQFIKGDLKAFDIEDKILEKYRNIFIDVFTKMMNSEKNTEDEEFKHIVQCVNIEILTTWLTPIIESLYKSKASKEKKSGFSSWFSSATTSDSLTDEEQSTLESIALELKTNKTVINKQAFIFQYNVILDEGWITLASVDEGSDSFKLKFTQMNIGQKGYGNRSIINATLNSIDLSYFQELGQVDYQITNKELSLTSVNKRTDEPIASFSYTSYSDVVEYESELILSLLSQDVIYNHSFINLIQDFFTIQIEENLKDKAFKDLSLLVESSQEKLKANLSTKQKIDIQISERCLYMPIQKEDTQNSQYLVFNFGHLSCTTPAKNSIDPGYEVKYVFTFCSLGLKYFSSFDNIIKSKEGYDIFNDISGSVKIEKAILSESESQIQLNDRVIPIRLTVEFGAINMNLTEYHYSILLSLGQIFALKQSGKNTCLIQAEEELKDKKVIGIVYVQSFGIAGNWIPYWGIISNGYLYFYKKKGSLHSFDSFNLKGCVVSFVSEETNGLSLKNHFKSINIQFPSKKEIDLFKDILTSINLLSNEEESYHLIHQRENISTEMYLEGRFNLQMISCTFTDSSHQTIKQYTVQIENNNISLSLSERTTDLSLSIQHIRILNRSPFHPAFTNIIETNPQTDSQNNHFVLVKLQLDNITSLMEVNMQLGYLNIIYNPITINHIICLLTTKPYYSANLDQISLNESFISSISAELPNCRNSTEETKINAEMKSINIKFIQPSMNVFFFEINFEQATFQTNIKYDHMEAKGSVGSLEVFDLMNYPFTIKSQDEYQSKYRQIILGSKKDTKSLIDFDIQIYQPSCPLMEGNINGNMKMDLNSIFLIYVQEMFLRILNYVLNEIVPSFTNKLSGDQASQERINEEKDSTYGSIISLDISLINPQLILKPRLNSNKYFFVDLGTVKVTNGANYAKGRIIHLPEEERLIQVFQLVLNGAKIQSDDGFILSDTIKGTINISSLAMKSKDFLLNKGQVDSSLGIDIFLSQINLNLRQKDFTELMRCVDLNMVYKDNLEKEFMFNEFSSSNEILFKAQITNANESKQKKIEIKIDSFFEMVNLKLMLEDIPFTEMSLNNMYLKVITYEDTELTASFVVSEISLRANSLSGHDQKSRSCPLIRSNSILENKTAISQMNEYNELIQSKQMLPSGDFKFPHQQLSFDFNMNCNKEKRVDITLDSLIVFVKLDTIYLLSLFFMEGLPNYTNEHADNCPNAFDPNEDNVPLMLVELKTQKLSLCLLSDSLQNGTQDIIYLSSEFIVKYQKEKISDVKSKLKNQYNDIEKMSQLDVEIKDINLALHTLNELTNPSKQKERKVMNQLSINFTLSSNLEKHTNNSLQVLNKININFEEIELKLSYRDIVIALSISEYEMNLIGNDFEKFKAKLTQTKELPTKSKMTDSLIETPTQSVKSSSNDENYDIYVTGTKEIRIILINNDNETYYPFLTLIFKSFFFINKSKGDTYSNTIASFNLQAYSFNYLASYWEPLIESFPFYSTIIMDSTSPKESKYSFEFNVDNKDITKINISDLTIEFTYRNLNAWIDKFLLLKSNYQAQIGNVIKEKYTQSIISNHKIFNYSGKSIKLKSLKEEYAIGQNKSIDLEFYPESNEGRAIFTKKMKYQKVYSFDYEGLIKSNIDIDNLMTKYHLSNTKSISKYLYIASKVELNALKKFIYFYAPLVFRNKTQNEITLIFSSKGKEEYTHKLIPGECCGVPSDYLEGETRFIFDSNEDWKLKTLELLTEPGVLKEKQTKQKYYILYYKRAESNREKYRIIEIKNCCLVKNCLPINIILTIPLANKSFIMKKNESQIIDCVSFYSILRAKIELDSISQSTDVILYNPENKAKTSILKLNSYENSTIEISSTIYNEEERLIVLYSEQVLVNLGGDTLQFYYGNKRTKLTKIPNQQSQVNMFILNQSINHLILFQYKGLCSDIINLKELPSFLEIACNSKNSNSNIQPKNTNKKEEFEFVLESQLSLIDINYNLYSTVVTICPKYYILNQTDMKISLQFRKCENKLLLYPYFKDAFDFFGLNKETRVILQPLDQDNKTSKWKPCHPLILLSNTMMTLQFNSSINNDKLYLNIEKCKEAISTVIYITQAKESNSQFVLHNKSTQMECNVYQKKYKDEMIHLLSNSKTCFSYTNPLDEHIICIEKPEWEFVRFIEIKEKSYIFYSDEYDKGEHVFSVSQIISLSQMNCLLKITLESTGFQTIIRIEEEKRGRRSISQKEKNMIYEVGFKMNCLGIDLFGDNRNLDFQNNIRKYIRTDLLYLELSQVKLYYQYDNDTKENIIQFCIQDLKISNETSVTNYYPMVLTPLIEDGLFQAKDKPIEEIPIVNILASYKVNENNKMNVSELNFSFQPFKLKAESNLLLCLYNFIQNITLGTQSSVTSFHPIYSTIEENQKKKIHIQGPYIFLLKNEDVIRETNLIIDLLNIPSFKVILSFLSQSDDFLQTVLKTNVFLSSIFGTMSSIENVPLNLNGCEIKRFTGNWNDLSDSIFQHYKEHILRQGYKIFGGISILGSPNTFLSTCSDGVNDLYKEPKNGFKNGPLQGFVGIAKGGASLVQHTVEGTFNSTSQISSGISKAILLVSQDDEYMKEREKNKITEKPKNILEGVGFGMKSLASGFFHGVTDIVSKPIEGAKEDNLKGFGKGLLKGFGGIISKPVSGLFDLVSKTTEGIKNNVSKIEKETQLRLPRVFYGKYKVIKNYNVHSSELINSVRRSTNEYDNENLGLCSSFDIVINHNKKKKELVMIFTSEGIILFNSKKSKISNLLTKQLLNYSEIKEYQLVGNSCIAFILTNMKVIKVDIDIDFTDLSKFFHKMNKAIYNNKIFN